MAHLTLTRKTLLFLVITLAIIITLRVSSARLIIFKEFGKLEADLTRQNVERLFAAVDRESEALVQILGDWCAWNDTGDFISGTNPAFIAANLSTNTFANLGLHLIVLADVARRYHWAKVYASDEDALAAPSAELVRFLDRTDVLWAHPDATSRKVGLMNTPMGLMLVASGPVVDSDSSGPVRGYLFMGRLFGPAAVAAMGKRMQMEVDMRPLADDPPPPIVAPQQRNQLTHGAISLAPLDATTLRASCVLADMAGRPAVKITVDAPRSVTAQGHRTIRHFLFWQAVGGVLVTLLVIVFIRRVILRPITLLNQQVTAIAASSTFSQRVAVTTQDEVGGTSRAINQMLSALEGANDKVQTAYDELKKTQAKLVQSAKLASIGELAAGMAHELNQPLTVIRGTAQMLNRALARKQLDREIMGRQLNLIERNTSRMMNIIEQLRTFSIHSVQVHSWTDLNKAIQGCLVFLGDQLRVSDIAVTLDLDEDLPKIWCDRNQMEQVVLSLLTNAFDAIVEKTALSEGDRRGGMHLSTNRLPGPPEMVEIRVRDNGVGIRKDRLDWIFDPFFTTKEVGKGTGLGLSISYGIIQDHRGDLRVEDTGSHGTTFVIRLPVTSTDKDAGGSPAVEAQA
jgi:signal transduction histidine kinase